MIQNSPFFLLDLDVVNDVLPTKDGSLSLDDAFVDSSTLCLGHITGLDGTVGSFAAFWVVGFLRVLECSWDLALLEYEDFTLGLFGRNCL